MFARVKRYVRDTVREEASAEADQRDEFSAIEMSERMSATNKTGERIMLLVMAARNRPASQVPQML